MKYKYYILPENIWSGDLKDNYKSRSKIGKKAYRTFLKNGGSRNSKGQFSKKQNIDWKKIGSQLWEEYMQNAGSVDNIDNVKAFAKVFQKHGLIDKGVEI